MPLYKAYVALEPGALNTVIASDGAAWVATPIASIAPAALDIVTARASVAMANDVTGLSGSDAWAAITGLAAAVVVPSGGVLRGEVRLGCAYPVGSTQVYLGYQVDGGSWVACVQYLGAWATASQGFSFEISGLSAASHSIQIGVKCVSASTYSVPGASNAPSQLLLTAMK